MKSMYKNEPLVYIILVNYNGTKDTLECVKSLKDITYHNYRIIVVDNNSTMDSKDLLLKSFEDDDCSLIFSDINLGFAGGNNLGIKKALVDGADYILLLNNDTVVDKNFLEPMIQLAEGRLDAGVVGGKIFYYDTPDTLWFAGGKINTFTGKTKHVGYKQKDSKVFDRITEMDYITGCMLLVRKDVIQKVGLMNDDYFLYYEEVDWNVRIKKCGYRIFYTPFSKIFHKESASTKKMDEIRSFYFDRNRYVFIMRNYSYIHKGFMFIYYRILLLLKLLKAFIKGDLLRLKIIQNTLISISEGSMGMYKK